MPRRKYVTSTRKLLDPPKITLRARRFDVYSRAGLEPVSIVAGLNEPESRIYHALVELGVRFEVQAPFFGNNYLGGARADFLLHDYGIDLEYQGPFHGTAYGVARDVLRNMGLEASGYRVVPIYERDLADLKRRLLEIIGVPVGV